MSRLLLAIELPDLHRQILSSMGMQIQGSRGVNAEQIHITVRFIGEVNGQTKCDIEEILANLIAAPFSLKISRSGFFPPRGKPKVIWAGIQKKSAITQAKKRGG